MELQRGWGLDKCQLADPLTDEDWGKQLEDLAEIISASLIESVHLPLAVQVCNSGLSKFTPAPFSCLVKSCWQGCVLLAVHLFLFPNVGCQGSAWGCLEVELAWLWGGSLSWPATCSDTLSQTQMFWGEGKNDLSMSMVAENMVILGWEGALFTHWDRFCSIWLQVSDAPIPLKRNCGINLCENGFCGVIATRQTKIHHGTIRCWEGLAGHGLSFLLYSLFPCSPLLTFYSLTHTDSE